MARHGAPRRDADAAGTQCRLPGALPWLAWVRAFTEAAAVGAIGDWFAVTALFRHPLGLPIPHTAIIPKNKDDIGANLGHFVEHNFLTPENVIRKLESRNLALAAADWLAEPVNSAQVARRLCAQVPLLLEKLGDDDLQRAIGRALHAQLEELDLARVAGEVLELLTVQDRHQALLNHGLEALDVWLADNRPFIKAKVSEASRYTLPLVDSFIANRFVDGVLNLLHEVVADPHHEVRARFDRALRGFVHDLKTSGEYRASGEEIKKSLLQHLQHEAFYRQLWEAVKQRLLADLAGTSSALREHAARALIGAANVVREDRALQHKLNTWALQAIESLLIKHRHQVSLLITEVVKSWDAREVSARVETEIGKDLQFIRINGTVVGGLVGLLLHAATRVIA
ncbi:MAG TPA: DUF445 domain-containing protein [Burkholderiaceae bacterium]|nr:DUF445 domain-containing protein [Burkholderiaceae bacterium]